MTNFDCVESKVENLIRIIKNEFTARTEIEGRRKGIDFKNAKISAVIDDNVLNFVIKTDESTHTITIPVPFIDKGVLFIKKNSVKRVVCNHFDVRKDKEIDYFYAMHKIFMDDFTGLVETVSAKKTMFVQQLAYSIINNNTSVIVHNLQKAINEFVNKMPLHETIMNSWVMNQRLMLIDPNFDSITDPSEKLQYHIDKNIKYFDRGWTSIGLSDGSLADKNYISKTDIRKLTAFGLGHHNPQRSLYSTLGMKGDELPRIRSKSANDLMNIGVTRKGWNLFTVFADIPDVFEDQIMVDSSHANKYITGSRRYLCFGKLKVEVGDKVRYRSVLSVNDDGEKQLYEVMADSSWISEVNRTKTVVGGVSKTAYNVVVTHKRHLKDGTKVTNTHGNKGVIRLKDLGHAIDPETGKERRIDIIAPAKTLGKRKNYGQLLEALINDLSERDSSKESTKRKSYSISSKQGLMGKFSGFVTKPKSNVIEKILGPASSDKNKCNVGLKSSSLQTVQGLGSGARFLGVKYTGNIVKDIVIEDDITLNNSNIDEIKSAFMARGFNEELTWDCKTYAGNFPAICGTVFWGVSKDVEDQLWDKEDTTRVNNKDLRTAGLKFSSVEFKALETIFGEDNPIMREVLSYNQGTEVIREELRVLNSKAGVVSDKLPIKSIFDLKHVDQTNGTMFSKEELEGTIADEYFEPGGFLIQLPFRYQTAVGVNREDNYEGMEVLVPGRYDPLKYKNVYVTDKVYVPSGFMRRSWKHSSGAHGMSETSVLINTMVTIAKRMKDTPDDYRLVTLFYRTIAAYFNNAANSITSKKGSINNYGMSVRYPYSAKAVATLSNNIEPNTVQIHKDMAEILEVSNGDIVVTERFPCLGFMGIRLQKVNVTTDPLCKYTIRVSGNNAVSQNLDFDGDVLYIASFHNEDSVDTLRKEFENPSSHYWGYIDWLNNRKGAPRLYSMGLSEYGINSFKPMDVETQATIVSKLTGIKAQTGPVIAMAYNLMRVIENSGRNFTPEEKAAVEMFIEKAGQSVFEQKHGGQSLHDIVIEAICTANSNILVEEGFDKNTSRLICDIIVKKAAEIGVNDVVSYHEKVTEAGGSNVLSKIVRSQNKIYVASRNKLDFHTLFESLNSGVVDLSSRIFRLVMEGQYSTNKTVLNERKESKMLDTIRDDKLRDCCKALMDGVERMMCA